MYLHRDSSSRGSAAILNCCFVGPKSTKERKEEASLFYLIGSYRFIEGARLSPFVCSLNVISHTVQTPFSRLCFSLISLDLWAFI